MTGKAIRTVAAFSCSMLALTLAQVAHGQTSDARGDTAQADLETSTQIADIIVTATRRETSLQSTPLAITALTPDALDEAKVSNLEDLPRLAPSLTVAGAGGQENPFGIRGIASARQGPGGDTPVAVYLDGVYIGQPLATFFAFPDIDRIEVTRGPQGTLFGRNATGGAISIITQKPSADFSGRMLARYGGYGTRDLNGYVTGPVAGGIYLKLGGAYHNYDGFQRYADTGDPANRNRSKVLTAGLRLVPTSNLEIDIRGDYSNTDLAPPTLRWINAAYAGTKYGLVACPLSCDRVYGGNEDTYNRVKTGGLSATATWRLEAVTLKSISAYRDFRQAYQIDNDATEYAFQLNRQNLDAHQFSQEAQLASAGDGPFKWLVGAYYFEQRAINVNINRSFTPASGPYNGEASLLITAGGRGVNDTNSYAGFVNLDYDVTPRLSIGAGARYSYEVRRFSRTSLVPGASFGAVDYAGLKRSFDGVTPRVDIQYKFSDRIFAYASYSRGMKAGGFNFAANPPYSPVGPVTDPSFGPEHINSYELGLRTTLADRQLRFNLTGFHYDYTGLQVSVQTGPGILTIYNAATAKVDGIEAEFDIKPRALKGLSISGAASWLDARYDRFMIDGTGLSPAQAAAQCIGGAAYSAATRLCDLSGLRLPLSPRWSGNIGIDYEIGLSSLGSLTPRVDVQHRAMVFYSPFNRSDIATPAYTDLDLSLSWQSQDRRWRVTGWVRNVTNEHHITLATANSLNAAAANPALVPGTPFAGLPTASQAEATSINPPRTFGLDVSLRF